jgi:hypothetical protein
MLLLTLEEAGTRTLLFTSGLMLPGTEVALEFVRLDDLGGVGVSNGSKVEKKTGFAGLSIEEGS